MTQSEEATVSSIRAELDKMDHKTKLSVCRVLAWAWGWKEPIMVDGKKYAPWSYK